MLEVGAHGDFRAQSGSGFQGWREPILPFQTQAQAWFARPLAGALDRCRTRDPQRLALTRHRSFSAIPALPPRVAPPAYSGALAGVIDGKQPIHMEIRRLVDKALARAQGKP
jgi:hypothetical protein